MCDGAQVINISTMQTGMSDAIFKPKQGTVVQAIKFPSLKYGQGQRLHFCADSVCARVRPRNLSDNGRYVLHAYGSQNGWALTHALFVVCRKTMGHGQSPQLQRFNGLLLPIEQHL